MENEKDLSDSEIESDLEEDIVFGKLFDLLFLLPKNFVYFLSQILHFTHIFERNKTS
jgi:hypothetical protein